MSHNLVLNETTVMINGQPVSVPDDFTEQSFQDQINAAKEWEGHIGFLAINFIWGGKGDLQRPNGADSDNFIGTYTAAAAYLYGACAAVTGLTEDQALRAAATLNTLSTSTDHSGIYGLPQDREDQIRKAYTDYGNSLYAPDSSTSNAVIDGIVSYNMANLPRVSAALTNPVIREVNNTATVISTKIASAINGLVASAQSLVADAGQVLDEALHDMASGLSSVIRQLLLSTGYYVIGSDHSGTASEIAASVGDELEVDQGVLEAINSRFTGTGGDAAFAVGGIVHVPVASYAGISSFAALPKLPEGQNYVVVSNPLDATDKTVYVVGGSTNAQYADGALILENETSTAGTYKSYAQNSYTGVSRAGSDLVVHLAGENGATLFSFNITTSSATFFNGASINLAAEPADSITLDTEAETPMEHVLAYLAQLGEEVTGQELIDENRTDLYPEQTPFTATYDASPATGGMELNYWNPAPGAIVTPSETVTIEGNVYNVVHATLRVANADISRDDIDNVDQLFVHGIVSLTEDQFNGFSEFSGEVGPISATDFGLRAATGGTFDASGKTVTGGASLILLEATDWSGTTLIGSDQDGQILQASLLGEDTLEAGDGEDTVLVAGLGVNTLIGSASGGTTFVASQGSDEFTGQNPHGDGLAAGSVVEGSGTGNVLRASGDITEATISGVQTLYVNNNIQLTAEQFDDFDVVEGSGTLYAATGGTYDWSEQSVDFSSAYALSSEGTTLTGNANLYASEDGDDTLIAPDGGSLTLDASNSTGDVTMTVGDGNSNSAFAGFGVNTITLGTGTGNNVYADHGLAAGSSVTFENSSNNTLTVNGDISGATITGMYTLATDTGVTLSASQLSGVSAISHVDGGSGDLSINASSAGTYSLSGKTVTAGTTTLNGSIGADTLTGGTGAETINGDEGDDTITGGGGADTVNGGDGNDTITGGSTASTLNGDDENDTITGGSSTDTISGGAGDDTITGGAGADTIAGEDGNDTIIFNASEVPSGETINGGNGTDRVTVTGNNMSPGATLSNMEELYLNNGVTAINLTAVQLDDFSTITHQSGGSQAFNITAQAAGTYSIAGKTITGILTLNGSSGNDTLTGSSGNDILRGMAGADTINAGDGNDNIQIFPNEVPSGESIDGGNGTDRLTVGSSGMNPSAMTVSNMEELYLNSGVTAVTLSASQLADFETITQATSAGFTITAASAGTYSLSGKTLTGAATLSGSSGADTLTGSSNADTVNGNAGNDLIEGGAGNDTLNGGNDTDTLTYANAGSAVTVDISNGSAQNTGGAGTDTISNVENLTGSAYNDTLTGTSSANILLGGDGNDGITGGGGNDTIDGGVGTNTLTGGTGNDIYKLERTYGVSDIVENDSTGGNTDVLQLGSDIAIDQMWFRQSGNDLLINVIGTDAQMTVKDWYLGSDYQVEQIATNGSADTLSNTNVQNLVNAMSSLSMPETTTLSEGYHTALDSVIAANWA